MKTARVCSHSALCLKFCVVLLFCVGFVLFSTALVRYLHKTKLASTLPPILFCYINSLNACTIGRTVSVARSHRTKWKKCQPFRSLQVEGRPTIARKFCTLIWCAENNWYKHRPPIALFDKEKKSKLIWWMFYFQEIGVDSELFWSETDLFFNDSWGQKG